MDLYQVYESDFVREVKDIVTHGFSKHSLEIRPYAQHAGEVGENWSDFAWQADGQYSSFVRHAAVVFITLVSVIKDYDQPSWLVRDLSGIPATYSHTSTTMARALESLRMTSVQSKTNRAPDPLMIDALLQCAGFKDEKNVNTFVNKHNATVFYDQALCFNRSTAARQVHLLNVAKIPLTTKEILRQRVNTCENFDHTGLGLDMMSHGEFWANTCLSASTHESWRAFQTTSEGSQRLTLQELFDAKDQGTQWSVRRFQAQSRKNTMFHNLCQEQYVRYGIREKVKEMMAERVNKGQYDCEFWQAFTDLDEDVTEGDVRSFDEHLLQNYCFLSDAVELHRNFEEKQKSNAENTETEAKVGMDDNAWFISELNHDYAKFKKLSGERDEAKKSLEKKEKKYENDVRDNVKEATKGFVDTYAAMMTFRADEDQFVTHLPAELEKRVAQVADVCSCTPADVLKVCLVDLGSFGAPGVATMDFAERVSAITAGADGLALFVCSETPAGKGRTLVGPSPKKPRVQDGANQEGAAEPAASGAVEAELPVAPSTYPLTRVRFGSCRCSTLKRYFRLAVATPIATQRQSP